jgi:DNA primase catalytic subunit
MLDKGVLLRFYKQKEVLDEIVELAKEREIAVRYNDKFGKRPDIIQFPNDAFSFAKSGVTSFHCSEERWYNPLNLNTSLKQNELDELRCGWDLVIDIDCPIWKYSKLIALLVVSFLKKFGIKSISCKFSGNKGFHIAVPFESFPKKFHGEDIEKLFPEAPKKIALYMSNNLEKKMVSVLSDQDKQYIAEFLKEDINSVFMNKCVNCGEKLTILKKNKFQFHCHNCGNDESSEEKRAYLICPKCEKIMDPVETNQIIKCPKCESIEFEEEFDISRILDIDTLLISSRHMFRMAYSLHEKSGLVSLPLELNEIKGFKREMANPEIVKVKKVKFLDRNAIPGEANSLLIQAYDFTIERKQVEKKVMREFELPETPILEEFFPPCMNKILAGLEDGRKRSIFIVQNFLSSMGWNHDQIEVFVEKWNKNNKPPLKFGTLNSQAKAFKKKKLPILPPNCENTGYYKNFAVCAPDGICRKIKNPVQYYKYKIKRGKTKKVVKEKVSKEKVDKKEVTKS